MYNNPTIVTYGEKIKFTTNLQMNLLIEYHSINENKFTVKSKINIIYLLESLEELIIDFRNQSVYAIDQWNQSCIFAFKLHGKIGFGINLELLKGNYSQFKILFSEYFLVDINFLTIKNMTLLNTDQLLTDSFQITLVIQFFNCNFKSNQLNLKIALKLSKLSLNYNIIDKEITNKMINSWLNKTIKRTTLQIINYVETEIQNSPFYYIKINELKLINNWQNYLCNLSGIYIYNHLKIRFGPYCYTTDFIPMEKSPFTIIYYYFNHNDKITNGYDNIKTIFYISLEFYPCKLATLHSFTFLPFSKCWILYQPITTQPCNITKKIFFIQSDSNMVLFKIHSKLNLEFKESIIDWNEKIDISIFQSKKCYFGFTIYKNESGRLIIILINSSCPFVPNDWSIHLELISRRRIQCNKFSDISTGIISFNTKEISNNSNQDFVMPICTWYFKKPNENKKKYQIRMLLLEIDIFKLDCDVYQLQMFETIGSAIHKLNLCNDVKHGDVISSRSDGEIYISLKYSYQSHRPVKLIERHQFDEFVIFFKYITKDYNDTNQIGCEVGWWKIDKNCYKFEKPSNDISWNTSYAACKSKNASLIKIDSKYEMDQLNNLSISRWINDIYSSTNVIIFIGLKNRVDLSELQPRKNDLFDLTWIQNEPLLYHQWYLRSDTKTYSYVSSSLKGIINSVLRQPSLENNGQFCTAMMWQHPLYWSNWVKIPCESNLNSASYICQKPVALTSQKSKPKYKTKSHFKTELDKINDIYGFRCKDNWFLIDGHCLMLVYINNWVSNLKSYCNITNSNMAQFSEDEAKKIGVLIRQLFSENIHFDMYYQDISDIKYIPDMKSIEEFKNYHYVVCERNPQKWSQEISKPIIYTNSFWCGDLDQYWISVDKICDNEVDCLLSKNDENKCTEKQNIELIESRQLTFDCSNNNSKYISWNKYCNFINDCPNGNDENQCSYCRCNESEWQCHNKQCISIFKRCDKTLDCIDESDEKDCDINMCNGFKCKSSVCLPQNFVMDDIVDCPGSLMEDEALPKENCLEYPEQIKIPCSSSSNKCMELNNTCIYNPHYNTSRDTCPLLEHLKNCEYFICPHMYQCTKMKYCIELHNVCDGIKHCPDGDDEEEENCLTLQCPFHFRCWSRNKKFLLCVNKDHVCDGIINCPNGEDELYCDGYICPDGCECLGNQIVCDSNYSVNISEINKNTKSLTINNVERIVLDVGIFSSFINLGYLNLSQICVMDLFSESFVGLFNLIYLILNRNQIHILPEYLFLSLKQVKYLDLTGNPIKIIQSYAFHDLVSLKHLQLASMKLTTLSDWMFSGMSDNLKSINVSYNEITSISKFAFRGISNLSMLAIRLNQPDISITGKPLKHVTVKNAFTDVYKICCSLASYNTCSVQSDISSNCEDLLANKTIQVIVWAMGMFGLLGNILVIIWRISATRKNKFSTEEILILNLAISDFLMGIYLIIIASKDKEYRNYYIEYSISWKSSLTCKVAGYLAAISNQASVSFIGLITLDRFVCIIFHRFRCYTPKIKYLILPIWFIWILVMCLFWYFNDLNVERVESSSLCLSYFFFEDKYSNKANFSTSLLSYILISLILIVTGYFMIFVHSCRTRRTAGRILMLNDYKSARKLLILISTCILCWFPIIILSFLSKYNNYTMENDQLTWLTVVLMPINSSLNPYLYTFSNVNLCIKRKINNSNKVVHSLKTFK